MDNFDELKHRIAEQFQYVDETALVVLKGHLLIEELLDTIISAFVFHPHFIEKARLQFAQKIAVARSISLDEHNNEMWSLAVKLNALRNNLAHSLRSQERAAKTRAVIDAYLRLAPESSAGLKDHDEHLVLAAAVYFFMGFLHTFHDEVCRFRGAVDALDSVMNPHRHVAPAQK